MPTLHSLFQQAPQMTAEEWIAYTIDNGWWSYRDPEWDPVNRVFHIEPDSIDPEDGDGPELTQTWCAEGAFNEAIYAHFTRLRWEPWSKNDRIQSFQWATTINLLDPGLQRCPCNLGNDSQSHEPNPNHRTLAVAILAGRHRRLLEFHTLSQLFTLPSIQNQYHTEHYDRWMERMLSEPVEETLATLTRENPRWRINLMW